ncbi:YbjN domain-containing protein [Erythrobacter sp. F6033]|uniref:YbjN domain-containing protein n=1 Tax=Erythrobacter sp. F6033 TaxID=2926401 RepID=UPI001FF6BE91|nr:YbjN domain-containing protein [Erythrobacter sp. F6033]MCK0127775.1 YbjN domain-containing protein [Erythrobacter sp. F6033]
MNFFRTAGSLSIAATALFATAAHAQPKPIESIDQTEVIERINETTVSPALAVVTGNQMSGADPQGDVKLIATATNGLRFEISFRACETDDAADARHCKAMYMMSIWDAPAGGSDEEFQSAIVGYLQGNPAINAGRLPDGSPYIVRYVIADFGTAQGNLVSEFANFIRSATDFQNTISPFYPQGE